MNAFLLTWSPKGYSVEDLAEDFANLDKDPEAEFDWNITAHRQALPGDVVVLYRQGPGDHGLFAFGTIKGSASRGEDADDRRWYFPLRLERWVFPWKEFLLTQDEALRFFSAKQLSAPASGYPARLGSAQLDELLTLLRTVQPKPASSPPGYRTFLTVKEFTAAFQAVEVTPRERELLITLYELPDDSGTLVELAETLGFSDEDAVFKTLDALGQRVAAWAGFAEFADDPEKNPGASVLILENDEDGVVTLTMFDEVAGALERLGWVGAVDEPDAEEGYAEGRVVHLVLTHYERSPEARAAALAVHGCRCATCGFDFEMAYGERGRGFIEVHHLNPLHQTGATSTDPAEDLRPVCPNCHRVIHRRKPMLTIPETQALVDAGKVRAREESTLAEV